MSVAVGAGAADRPSVSALASRWAKRNTWTLGLFALLAGFLVLTKIIQPSYDQHGIQGLVIGALPLAFAAVAQAIVVISGGIDLSIGSMMALTSVTAAVLMKGQSEEVAVLVVLGVLVMGLVLGIINGALVVVTKVPDIVVTLAMSFVWAGAALLVLIRPGGASAEWLKQLVAGSILSDWVPKAIVFLIVAVAIVWIPLRRSTTGLAIYAVGSNRLAAFRSGVSVGRTKVFAYTLGGFYSALGDIVLTATTGDRNAGPRGLHPARGRRHRPRWGQPGRRPWRRRRARSSRSSSSPSFAPT